MAIFRGIAKRKRIIVIIIQNRYEFSAKTGLDKDKIA